PGPTPRPHERPLPPLVPQGPALGDRELLARPHRSVTSSPSPKQHEDPTPKATARKTKAPAGAGARPYTAPVRPPGSGRTPGSDGPCGCRRVRRLLTDRCPPSTMMMTGDSSDPPRPERG